MLDWRTLQVGEELTYTVDDFEGFRQYKVIVTSVTSERAIAELPELDNMELCICDCTADMFSR